MRSFILLALLALTGCDASGRPNIGAAFAPPPVPVEVYTRPAYLGSGLVAVFSNQSSSRVTVSVRLDAKNGENMEFSLDLDPNGREEVGWMEGWAFKSGDTVRVTHRNHSDLTWRVP
jgi:hypothetical protein